MVVEGAEADCPLKLVVAPAAYYERQIAALLAVAAATEDCGYPAAEGTEEVAESALHVVLADLHFLYSANQQPTWPGTADWGHFPSMLNPISAASKETYQQLESSWIEDLALQFPPLATLGY